MKTRPERRLANFRDLGGLPLVSGGHTREGVLLRSEAPFPGDLPPRAATWPPRLVLDLRSAAEAPEVHPLLGPGTEVHRTSFYEDVSPIRADPVEGEEVPLDEFYADAVRVASPPLAELLRRTAEAPGPVLVHCTAGKDRTGMVVATVLRAVGVERVAIEADYLASGPNMAAVAGRLEAGFTADQLARLRTAMRVHPDLLAVDPFAIAAFLDALEAHPGGAAGLMLSAGLPEQALASLRRRLAPPPGSPDNSH